LSTSLRSWLVMVVIAGTWPGSVSAQGQWSWRCESVRPALSERTDWYDEDGDYIRDTTPQDAAALSKHFRREYLLLLITTEGRPDKVIDEYELRWAPPTVSQGTRLRRIPAVASGALSVPLVGTLTHRRSATMTAVQTEPPRVNLRGPIRLEYWSARGKLGFNIGLGIDVGTLFHITDVEADGSFAGRWSDGGLTSIQFDTPMGALLEKVRGYLCGALMPG
jgi:hypothetical protein